MKVIAAILLLAGCTAIDYSKAPPHDWPHLEVIELRTTQSGIAVICPWNFGSIPLACMRPDFDNGYCFIWLHHDAPEWVVKHEHDHCKGYDHITDNTVRDFYEQWKAERKSWRE